MKHCSKMWSVKGVNIIGFIFLLNIWLNSAMDMGEAMKFLHKYGYLEQNQTTNEKAAQALINFQKFFRINRTGLLDEETVKMMSQPRCGMPDDQIALPATARARLRSAWNKRQLTYNVYPNQIGGINNARLQQLFGSAGAVWARNCNLNIRRGSGDADIRVFSQNIDGPSNTLAFAYFPNNGDVHMDTSERWSLGYARGSINIYWVIVHELGHSLGLDHSNDRRSVMYPTYQVMRRVDGSRADHIKLIRAYGPKPRRATASSEAVLCQNHVIDAMITTDANEIIVIHQDKYWIFSDMLQMQEGPLETFSLFPNLPNLVDAAFTAKNNVTYFLKENLLYKYQGNVQARKSTIAAALPELPNNINAAFQHRKSEKIYFLKGSTYFVMDTNIKDVNKRFVVKDKDISGDWVGVPNDISAATMLDDDRVLFVKGDRYFIYDMDDNKVEESGNFFVDFLNCAE